MLFFIKTWEIKGENLMPQINPYTGRPSQQRSTRTYSINGRSVTASQYAAAGYGATRTSGGQRTALAGAIAAEKEGESKLKTIEQRREVTNRRNELMKQGLSSREAFTQALAEQRIRISSRAQIIADAKAAGVRVTEADIRSMLKESRRTSEYQDALRQQRDIIKDERKSKIDPGVRMSLATIDQAPSKTRDEKPSWRQNFALYTGRKLEEFAGREDVQKFVKESETARDLFHSPTISPLFKKIGEEGYEIAEQKASEQVKKVIPERTQERVGFVQEVMKKSSVVGTPLGVMGFGIIEEPESVTKVRDVKEGVEEELVSKYVIEPFREKPIKTTSLAIAGGVGVSQLPAAFTSTLPIRIAGWEITSEISERTSQSIEEQQLTGWKKYSAIGASSVLSGLVGKRTGALPLIVGEFGYTTATKPIETAISIKEDPLAFGVSIVGFGIGASGAGSNYLYDIYSTRGMKGYELADFTTKPFVRTGEPVFMRRYGGFELFSPRSWLETYRGYRPGQFVKRQYRIIDPKVQARMKGKKDVTYWEIDKEGKPTQVKESTTPFPYDKPGTHFDWFTGRGVLEYGTPKRGELPKQYKDYGFGYSATGKTWGKEVLIGEAGQYYSGKGVSARFLRIGDKESPSTAIDLFDEPLVGMDKPKVYAGYFEKVKENPAITEVKVPNPYDPTAKPIKKYVFPEETGEGILNIPKMKPEVEGVVFGERVPIREESYFKLGGRRVPIEEQTFVTKDKPIIDTKTGEAVETIKEPQYSTLPSRPSRTAGAYELKSDYLKSSEVSSLDRSSARSSKYYARDRISDKRSSLSDKLSKLYDSKTSKSYPERYSSKIYLQRSYVPPMGSSAVSDSLKGSSFIPPTSRPPQAFDIEEEGKKKKKKFKKEFERAFKYQPSVVGTEIASEGEYLKKKPSDIARQKAEGIRLAVKPKPVRRGF